MWVLQNSDTNEDVVYPNDPRLKIKVDDDIQELWNGIKVTGAAPALRITLNSRRFNNVLLTRAPV